MLSQCLAVHQYIIEKYQNKLSQMLSENIVHQLLERCWGACEAKWHYLELIVPTVSSKC